MARVLIVGGTGPVEGAVAGALVDADGGVEVALAGHDRGEGETMVAALGERASLAPLDVTNPSSLRDALEDSDLVIHAAGPFHNGEPAVLAAAVESGVPYVDLADDAGYAQRAKRLHDDARTAGLPAVTSGAMFPGLSAVMAAELVERTGGAEGVAFSYFVGGGPALLASAWLLTCEPATEYVGGERREHDAFTGRRKVDFPRPVGSRPVYYVEAPEVTSIHDVFGVPDVSARFGTSPDLWNLVTGLAGRLGPRRLVKDRRRMRGLAERAAPAMRLLDRWGGKALGVRVDVDGADGTARTATYVHDDCLAATGAAAAALGLEVLVGRVAPGVWYPEEAVREREKFLERATGGGSLDLGPT